MVRERDNALVARVALDLSIEGMQVLTGARVLTGEPVRVTFRAPETGQWLTLQGAVARVLHGRRPNEWGRRLGVAFDPIAGTYAARLVEASARLDAR